ncbi:MAG: deoxyribose-phosphate aldolase [Deltaproteobacteria bacterium]|jgi:deoxyribose-phosphate aldolase|nr:deoxyribose-phosphate aldolase [Deltaproteobacteria bacterium]MBW2519996.1 deoxyribose-phosphate aldolase [Deltaproteobacteria bacterium]
MDSPAQYIDHTLLKVDTTSNQIELLCEEAVEYGFASVCIPPNRVALAARILYGSETRVGTVIGFPFGYEPREVKVFQASEAFAAGADEIDMVIDLGAACEGRLEVVKDEIERLVSVAEGKTVKVIIECCLFDQSLKKILAEIAVVSGANYVKTSTGFSKHGATLEDVRLLAGVVAPRAGVKASGGIRDWPTCQAMIAAGACRIGSSHGTAIVQQWFKQESLD